MEIKHSAIRKFNIFSVFFISLCFVIAVTLTEDVSGQTDTYQIVQSSVKVTYDENALDVVKLALNVVDEKGKVPVDLSDDNFDVYIVPSEDKAQYEDRQSFIPQGYRAKGVKVKYYCGMYYINVHEPPFDKLKSEPKAVNRFVVIVELIDESRAIISLGIGDEEISLAEPAHKNTIYVFAIDDSASAAETFDDTKRRLKKMISTWVQPGDYVALLPFNRRGQTNPVKVTDENRKRTFIANAQGLRPSNAGWSDFDEALQNAVKIIRQFESQGNQNFNKEIYLLCDGKHQPAIGLLYNYDRLNEKVRSAQARVIVKGFSSLNNLNPDYSISTVASSAEVNSHILELLAKRGNGLYYPYHQPVEKAQSKQIKNREASRFAEFAIDRPVYQNEPLEISVSLHHANSADAEVQAVIYTESGTQLGKMQLYDDGDHCDTKAKDGVFSNYFYPSYGQAPSQGYQVKVRADWLENRTLELQMQINVTQQPHPILIKPIQLLVIKKDDEPITQTIKIPPVKEDITFRGFLTLQGVQAYSIVKVVKTAEQTKPFHVEINIPPSLESIPAGQLVFSSRSGNIGIPFQIEFFHLLEPKGHSHPYNSPLEVKVRRLSEGDIELLAHLVESRDSLTDPRQMSDQGDGIYVTTFPPSSRWHDKRFLKFSLANSPTGASEFEPIDIIFTGPWYFTFILLIVALFALFFIYKTSLLIGNVPIARLSKDTNIVSDSAFTDPDSYYTEGHHYTEYGAEQSVDFAEPTASEDESETKEFSDICIIGSSVTILGRENLRIEDDEIASVHAIIEGVAGPLSKRFLIWQMAPERVWKRSSLMRENYKPVNALINDIDDLQEKRWFEKWWGKKDNKLEDGDLIKLAEGHEFKFEINKPVFKLVFRYLLLVIFVCLFLITARVVISEVMLSF